MNAPDLVKEFHRSHPAAIRTSQGDSNNSHSNNNHSDTGYSSIIQECIKTLGISEDNTACPPPHHPPSSSRASSETLLSGAPTSSTNSNLEHAYTSPTSTHLSIAAFAESTIAPTTDITTDAETPCLITPTSLVVDFPLLPYTLLELTEGSSLSGPTQKEKAYSCSLPLSSTNNLMSTSIGQVGTLEKKLLISPMKPLLSLWKDNMSSAPAYNTNQLNSITPSNPSRHKDMRPYLKKKMTWQEAQKEYSLPTNKDKKQSPMSQTVDTEAQEASMNQQYRLHRHNPEKLKEERRKATQAFRRMHQQWRLSIELVKHVATADHFRSKSSDTALFLQKIYPPLYDAASKRLRAKGITPPLPVLSRWAHFLNNKHFIVNLKLALAADRISNRVAPIPLEGTSCYDLGTRPIHFSYPPETPSTVTITYHISDPSHVAHQSCAPLLVHGILPGTHASYH